MNIIEAVRSGKNFKRNKLNCWNYSDSKTINLYREDILATDWEVEERKIEITESEFDEALIEVSRRTTIGGDLYVELKKRLFEK